MKYRDVVKQYLVESSCPEEAHEGVIQIAVSSYEAGQRDMRKRCIAEMEEDISILNEIGLRGDGGDKQISEIVAGGISEAITTVRNIRLESEQ